jgi:hypothetical protein
LASALPAKEDRIATSFTDAERKRFQGLLRLAAESPYVGERENALAAAHRLASRHGMTIEEAAGMDRPRAANRRPESSWRRTWFADYDAAEVDRFMHFNDHVINTAKSQRDAALREARARGLDAEELAAARRRRDRRPQASSRRLDPREHARVLLTETRLRLRDIVDITGLDIYQVVGLKLMLRRAA